MNKKTMILIVIVLILGIIITFWIVKRGDKKVSKEDNKTEITNSNHNQIDSNKKVAIIYFSATGTTKEVAELMKEVTGADIIEIIPESKYTSNDLNYNSDCRANREQQDSTARPKIANEIDVSNYDVIYLGYPIWWGTVPKIILTFLDTYDFAGKTVIPFCTSGGSGIEQSLSDLKNYNQDIYWIEGKRFTSTSKDEIQSWVNSLDIQVTEEEKKVIITVHDQKLTATLIENSSTKALLEKLESGAITIEMSDYGNFEKVGFLEFDLPRNDEEISTDAGDIILYQGNSLAIYYDKNNWNFTKLGHIDNVSKSELKKILGEGTVTVMISKE